MFTGDLFMVRFRENSEHFSMGKNLKKIKYIEDVEKIDLA